MCVPAGYAAAGNRHGDLSSHEAPQSGLMEERARARQLEMLEILSACVMSENLHKMD
jgi:hypothetical protein